MLLLVLQKNCEENGMVCAEGLSRGANASLETFRARGLGCVQSQLVGGRISERMSSNTPHCWTVVLPTGESLTPVKHSQKLGEPLETSCSGVGWSVKDRIQTNQRKKATALIQQQEIKMKRMQAV